MSEKSSKKPTKEIVIDLGTVKYCYGYYQLLIEKLELPSVTAMNNDALYDFLAEPMEQDTTVRFINYSSTGKDVKETLPKTLKMFQRVKKFQKNCGCSFDWSVE